MSGNSESSGPSSWGGFVKSLSSFNGDLSTMTAPPFILSPVSLTEYSAYWNDYPKALIAPANEEDPQKRAMLVLKWFLTTLRKQYSSRNEKMGSEKKPLNPFLGELFLGKWEDENGTTQLVSEQVSHHPPVTAYCIYNEKAGVMLQGYNGQKASFSNRIDVKQIGHAILHLDKYDEDYLITLPPLHIEGLFSTPFVELDRSTYIQSSSGYTAKIDYSGRGWFSGKKHSFHGSLYPEDKPKEPLYTVEGRWTESFDINDGSGKKKIDSWDGKKETSSEVQVEPIEKQDELESRRAWKDVADAIVKGDMNKTSSAKSKIEESQRELRKKEQDEGKEWERVFFSKVKSSPVFDKLAGKIGERIDADRTGGIWRYDEEKAKKAEKPYRKGTMPG